MLHRFFYYIEMKNKYITDAGMIAALYLAILLLSRLTGLELEYELLFLFPVLIALYTLKYDFKKSWIPAISTFSISFLLIHPLRAISMVFPSLLIGQIYGIIFKQKWNILWKILFLFLCFGLQESVICFIFSKALFGYTYFEYTDGMIQSFLNLLDSLSVSASVVNFIHWILQEISIFLLFFLALLEAILCHLFLSITSQRVLHLSINRTPWYLQFSFPFWIGYLSLFVYIICIILGCFYAQLTHFFVITLAIFMHFAFILLIINYFEGIHYLMIATQLNGRKGYAILSIISIIIFPISILVGLYSFLFQRDKRKLQKSISQQRK